MTNRDGQDLATLGDEMRKGFADCGMRPKKLEGVNDEGEPEKKEDEKKKGGGEGKGSAERSGLPIDISSLVPETLLTRRATADALTAAGFPVRPATLATLACRGGGPLYHLFGRKPLYRWGDALEWAVNRTSAPASSSAEHGLRRSPRESSAPVA